MTFKKSFHKTFKHDFIKFRLFTLISFLVFLPACGSLTLENETPASQSTPSNATAIPSPVNTSQAAEVSPTQPGPVTLRIWVPPEFDPASGTPAGDLLQERLDEFSKRRPGVQVEARTKAIEGPGGLLDSLTTASAAAPLALPDLIALPRDLMETAALKGLLYPYDNLSLAMDNPDWYDYAQQLARLQESVFGLPFAGDALVLVYPTIEITTLPTDWQTTLEMQSPLVFPASDPLALFTMIQYQASGGTIRDEEGRPYLDPEVLSRVLTFYSQAGQAEVMPYWLTQFQSDEQVWEAYREGRADLITTWSSRYLNALKKGETDDQSSLRDSSIALIPTENGDSHTLATGWVWALATNKDERKELSVELAEFLTTGNFLAGWTEAIGYLPPRPSALTAWSDATPTMVISQISRSASMLPSPDTLAALGTPLQQATVQVLKEQDNPVTAAQAAAASLAAP